MDDELDRVLPVDPLALAPVPAHDAHHTGDVGRTAEVRDVDARAAITAAAGCESAERHLRCAGRFDLAGARCDLLASRFLAGGGGLFRFLDRLRRRLWRRLRRLRLGQHHLGRFGGWRGHGWLLFRRRLALAARLLIVVNPPESGPGAPPIEIIMGVSSRSTLIDQKPGAKNSEATSNPCSANDTSTMRLMSPWSWARSSRMSLTASRIVRLIASR